MYGTSRNQLGSRCLVSASVDVRLLRPRGRSHITSYFLKIIHEISWLEAAAVGCGQKAIISLRSQDPLLAAGGRHYSL